jgi:histidyl-tRNA synthetase
MEFQKPRGTQDLFSTKAREYKNLIQIITDIAESFSYEYIVTPTFEETSLFLRNIGDTTDIVKKELYTFKDLSDRSLSLRPEGTVGAIRAVIENNLIENNITQAKIYYCGSMFRYERPQKGRLREFIQFGVENIGINSPLSVLETIIMCNKIIKKLNIDSITLKINNLYDDDTRKR